MEKKTSAPVRRPRKAAMAVMCVVTALLLVVNAAAAVLIPPNVTMINNFFNKGPSEAETVEAGEASAAMTQEVASEGIILLDNKNSALPLAQGSKVNLFGYGSRDTVYGGSGSGSGDESNNVTMAQGLTNAGFEVNQELVDFYDAHFVERTGVGYTGNNFDINEPPVSEYSQELLDNAKAFSDVALVVISRLGGDPGKHYLELSRLRLICSTWSRRTSAPWWCSSTPPTPWSWASWRRTTWTPPCGWAVWALPAATPWARCSPVG